jgi:hypothetical protein
MGRMTKMKIGMIPIICFYKPEIDLFLLPNPDPAHRKEVPPHTKGIEPVYPVMNGKKSMLLK